VAALVGAHHSGLYEEACGPIVPALSSRREIKLVFWLDEPKHSHILETTMEQRRRAKASFPIQKFKNRLKWLDARVMTASSVVDYNNVVPGLEAVSLPNDLQARAELLIKQLVQRGIDVSDVRPKVDDWTSKGCREEIDKLLCRASEISSARDLFNQRR
jgi:hypothetical protein